MGEILINLPGVWDGQPDSVHDARVASRRLREVLPLYSAAHRVELDEVMSAVKRAGRAMGAVRELDVMYELLTHAETHYPVGVGSAAVAKRALRQRQLQDRRRMIKCLEALELERLHRSIPGLEGRWYGFRERGRPAPWMRTLQQRIGLRATKLANAVDRTGGVYFPNRTHEVRVMAKKLRYSLEAARDTGLWSADGMVRDLRRVQNTLGELHDLQVLADEIDALIGEVDLGGDLAALKAGLGSDIDRHYALYVERRDSVLTICDASIRFAGLRAPWQSFVRRRPLLAASAVALPAILLMNRPRRLQAPEGSVRTSPAR